MHGPSDNISPAAIYGGRTGSFNNDLCVHTTALTCAAHADDFQYILYTFCVMQIDV